MNWNQGLEIPFLDSGNHMMNYEDMNSIMEAAYDSNLRQEAVKYEPDLLHTIFIPDKEIYSLPEGITKIADHINVQIRQAKFTFRDENQMQI